MENYLNSSIESNPIELFWVSWTPKIDRVFDYLSKFREITQTKIGGTRVPKYVYTDPTVKSVLSIGSEDNPSSFPQRIPLSTFKLGFPITSYGCIYRIVYEDESYYLLIKRKDSPSYIDLIHGNYRESQLYFIFQELNLEERRKLLNYEFDQLWFDLHLKSGEEDAYFYAKETFSKIRPYLEKLLDIVPSADPDGRNLWLFPKGKISRRIPTKKEAEPPNSENFITSAEMFLDRSSDNFIESPFECALREFKEETNGLDLNLLKAKILYSDPIAEKYLGTNSKSYQTNYFVFQSEGILPEIRQFERMNTGIRDLSLGEVDEIKLVPMNQIEEYLRPERCRLIQFIETNLPSEPVEKVSEKWLKVGDFVV